MTELDRQVEEYKQRADRGEEISRSDAIWLLNELIYERDHKSAAADGAGTAPPDPEEGDVYAIGTYYQAWLMSRAKKIPIGVNVGCTTGSSLDLAKRLADLLNGTARGRRAQDQER